MAGPQSFVPPRVQPSRPMRRFSLAEANRTLPLVKRIVGDIMRAHAAALELHVNLESLSTAKDRPANQGTFQGLLDRLGDLIHELTEVGCELKDPGTGLIDFLGRHQGRDVYLCWKYGEESITHWHELESGFAGRQPVSLLDESHA